MYWSRTTIAKMHPIYHEIKHELAFPSVYIQRFGKDTLLLCRLSKTDYLRATMSVNFKIFMNFTVPHTSLCRTEYSQHKVSARVSPWHQRSSLLSLWRRNNPRYSLSIYSQYILCCLGRSSRILQRALLNLFQHMCSSDSWTLVLLDSWETSRPRNQTICWKQIDTIDWTIGICMSLCKLAGDGTSHHQNINLGGKALDSNSWLFSICQVNGTYRV